MKKLIIFLAVLFVSVMSSACINNFAIQELNIKAKEYLDKGDYDEAIKRLESSVDLDGTVFETRYNLAVAYVNKEEFEKAVNQLKEAIVINPSNPDAYYTLGVAYEGEASNRVINKFPEEDIETEGENEKSAETFGTGIFKTLEDAQFAVQKIDEAIEAYKKYLELSKIPKDSEKVQEHINDLEQDKNTYLKEIESASVSNPAQGNSIQGE